MFAAVHGVCVNLPATHLEPGVVIGEGADVAGILQLGLVPGGHDEVDAAAAAALGSAGFRADVVCFDPETVRATATKASPRSYPVGIEYVIVNGEVVIERGENTGALSGRALRRGRGRT